MHSCRGRGRQDTSLAPAPASISYTGRILWEDTWVRPLSASMLSPGVSQLCRKLLGHEPLADNVLAFSAHMRKSQLFGFSFSEPHLLPFS